MTSYKAPQRRPNMPDWHAHQHLFRQSRKRRLWGRRIVRLVGLAVLITAAAYCITQCFQWIGGSDEPAAETASADDTEADSRPEGKQLARNLLQNASLINLKKADLRVQHQDTTLLVQTSIDPALQAFMLKKLDRKNSRYIALLALDPTSGEVVMMAGFDKIDPNGNPCLANIYPAASVFKIITAAAAADQQGLDFNAKLRFNGKAHTLYKNQLKDRNNRYTNHTTFQAAFAKSINPIFGKLGTLRLKKAHLEAYAHAFGFNAPIDFEVPVPPSRFSISDEPYHWAEIASGFNRQTTLTALHAALLPAVILNQGQQIDPTIVRQITDSSGKVLYRNRRSPGRQIITPRASRVVYNLMEATVRYGTGRKAFRGFRKDPVLSKCNLGGKTGSIFNRRHDLRYDWYVGFADLKNGDQKLAVAVVVAHEEYIGIRAAAYARMIIEKYYSDLFKTG